MCPPNSQREGLQEHHPLFWRFGTLGSWAAWKQHSSPLQWLWHQGWAHSARALFPLTRQLHCRWGSGPWLCLSCSCRCVAALCIPLAQTCWPASWPDLRPAPLLGTCLLLMGLCLSLTAITRPESLTYVDPRPIPLLLTCPPIWTLLIPYPGLSCLSSSDPVGWGPGWWGPSSPHLFPLCVVALRSLSVWEHLALAGSWCQSTVANTRKEHFHWLRPMVYMDENTVS